MPAAPPLRRTPPAPSAATATLAARPRAESRKPPVDRAGWTNSEQTTTLVRQELELAKAEVREKGRKAGQGAGMFGGAGVAALLGLGSVTAAAITLLDNAMSAQPPR